MKPPDATPAPRASRLAFLAGLLLAALFLLPLGAGWEKVFFDDVAFYFYPQQSFLARSAVRWIFPRWDPQLAAGATPFYLRQFGSSCYPLNWPFLLLGGHDPARSYLWLVKVPIALHFLLSYALAFAFARSGLGLIPAASLLLALAYALSPTMTYMALFAPELYVQAWLPAYCLCLTRYFRDGGRGWIALGAAAFALGSTGGDVAFVAHVMLITGLFGAGLFAAAALRRDRRRAIRVAAWSLAAFGVGFLLSGLYWADIARGLGQISTAAGESVEKFTGRDQSLHPLYLITLLVPDFFGGVTSRHTWGAAWAIRCTLNDANLLGGLIGALIIAASAVPAFRRRAVPPGAVLPAQDSYRIFLAIFVLGLIVVLGAYTPLYRLLSAAIPVLKMPYPVRFRSIECFAFAGLLGTGVHLLGEGEGRLGRRPAYLLLSVLAAFAALALLWPWNAEGRIFRPGFLHLTDLEDWRWFFRGVLLPTAAAAALALVAVRAPRRAGLRLLCAGALVEVLLFGYQAFYRNTVLNRRIPDVSALRFAGPADHPVYREVAAFHRACPDSGGMFRRGYFRSNFDNLGWVFDSPSALGFDLNPVDPRFREAIGRTTTGFPYELWPRDWSLPFWRNMSVRCLLLREPLPSGGRRIESPGSAHYFYALDDALPRAYFQDRWAAADEDESLAALLGEDLRERGYCTREDWKARPGDCPPDDAPTAEEARRRFRSLQDDDLILRADFSDPNRLLIEAELARPAMLVLTDLWHPDWRARLDGREAEIRRVNYFQRGIWCRPGRHSVALEFSPPFRWVGPLLTAAGLLALLLVWRFRRRFRRGHPGA